MGSQKRLGRRLEGVAKAVGGSYCRLPNAVKPGTCRRRPSSTPTRTRANTCEHLVRVVAPMPRALVVPGAPELDEVLGPAGQRGWLRVGHRRQAVGLLAAAPIGGVALHVPIGVQPHGHREPGQALPCGDGLLCVHVTGQWRRVSGGDWAPAEIDPQAPPPPLPRPPVRARHCVSASYHLRHSAPCGVPSDYQTKSDAVGCRCSLPPRRLHHARGAF